MRARHRKDDPDHDEDALKDGWRPSWKGPTVQTSHLSKLPDRDDLAVDPVPLIFSPVETHTGNELRLRAIEALEARTAKLKERAQHQRLTVIEQREIDESHGALGTLRRMAPVGALIEASAGDLFSGNLP